jgi:hypothetical protein
MNRLALAVVVLLVAAGSAAAARAHIVVLPTTVSPGGAVRLSATSPPCHSADTVSAISAAFPGNAFGSEGALTGRVTHRGAFTIRGHIRAGLRAGGYAIGFRCGGGNLGMTVTVRVR